MYLKLRIVFTILAALCVGAILPVGLIFGFGWAGLCIALAFLFFAIMWLCKQNQELDERKAKREQEKNEEKTANEKE